MKTEKSKTRYLILGLLSEGPLSGYEIKKIVDIRFSFFWSESYGQLYPELKRLEIESAIVPCESSDQDIVSKKNAKKYAITNQGVRQLQEWLALPVDKETLRFELLLKLYFSEQISPEVMMRHVLAFQIEHQNQLALFARFEEELSSSIDDHSNHRDILRVLAFGQKVYTAYDEWCSETMLYLQCKAKQKNVVEEDR